MRKFLTTLTILVSFTVVTCGQAYGSIEDTLRTRVRDAETYRQTDNPYDIRVFESLLEVRAMALTPGERENLIFRYSGVSSMLKNLNVVRALLDPSHQLAQQMSEIQDQFPSLMERTIAAKNSDPNDLNRRFGLQSLDNIQLAEIFVLEVAALIRLSANGHVRVAERSLGEIEALAFDISTRTKFAWVRPATKEKFFLALLRAGYKLGYEAIESNPMREQILADSLVLESLNRLQDSNLFETRYQKKLTDHKWQWEDFRLNSIWVTPVFALGAGSWWFSKHIDFLPAWNPNHTSTMMLYAGAVVVTAFTALLTAGAIWVTPNPIHRATRNAGPLNRAAEICERDLKDRK